MSAQSYFVYYKVRPERLEELCDRVRALFAAVERDTGVRGHWMRRRDDPETYMEVYEGVAEASAFEVVLEREVRRVGFAECLPAGGARRTEIFVGAQPAGA